MDLLLGGDVLDHGAEDRWSPGAVGAAQVTTVGAILSFGWNVPGRLHHCERYREELPDYIRGLGNDHSKAQRDVMALKAGRKWDKKSPGRPEAPLSCCYISDNHFVLTDRCWNDTPKWWCTMKELSMWKIRLCPQWQRTWYLRYHPVSNAKKSVDLHTVFDCATKFQGNLTNDLLLQGPGWSMPKIEILRRFWLGKDSSSGNIREAI